MRSPSPALLIRASFSTALLSREDIMRDKSPGWAGGHGIRSEAYESGMIRVVGSEAPWFEITDQLPQFDTFPPTTIAKFTAYREPASFRPKAPRSVRIQPRAEQNPEGLDRPSERGARPRYEFRQNSLWDARIVCW
jgi:hypothetical protein